ncbi:MAG: hypothetical protein NZO58_10425 [Gemmataceae bacterium]|nr:hypothetical protein [Gemmataceae bacterium]
MSVLILLAALVPADVSSGPPVGEKIGDFRVLGVTGPQANKEFQPIAEGKGKVTMLLFVQKITRPALQLLRPIDDYAAQQEKLNAHIVWLTGDKGNKDETKAFLEQARNSLNLQVPVSICLEGDAGPAAYGLNDRAAITILVAKDGKVVANFAYADPNATVAKEVIGGIAKALGKQPPKTLDRPGRPTAEFRNELLPLLRRLLDKEIDEAGVQRTVAAIQKWMGDDAEKRRQLQAAAQRILSQNLANEIAAAALKKLADQ